MKKLLLLVLLVVVPVAAAQTGEEIARKAAAVVSTQHKAHPRYSYRVVRANRTVEGKVVVEARYETRVHLVGDDVVRVDYLSAAYGGRTLTPAEMKQLANRAEEARKKLGRFRAPYDQPALTEYDYQADGRETVANHLCHRVRFRARVLDALHGHGVMWVDTQTFNVIKLTYELARNPLGGEKSFVELFRAPLLADLWAPVRRYQKMERGAKGYEESAFAYSDFREP